MIQIVCPSAVPVCPRALQEAALALRPATRCPCAGSDPTSPTDNSSLDHEAEREREREREKKEKSSKEREKKRIRETVCG